LRRRFRRHCASAGDSRKNAVSSSLGREVNQIPERSRKILMMKTQGYKYEEISAEMGLTVSGVKMQIKRSIEQLRSVLLDVTFLIINATVIIETFVKS
jgi:DNA-directed RNA polymerase specialized sigma24 family protein